MSFIFLRIGEFFFFLSYVNSENNCHFSWIFNNPPPKLLIFIVLLGNFQKRNLMIAYIIIRNCKNQLYKISRDFQCNVERMKRKKKRKIHEKIKKNGGRRCLTETERNMRNQHRDQWTNPPSYVEIKYSSVTAISGCAVQSNRARRSDYASAYTTAAANYIFEDLQEIIEQRSMLIVPSDSSVTSSQLYLIILPLSLS